MAKNKKTKPTAQEMVQNAYILGAGLVENQLITETLESNYMPYAMSVIMSRAIPEIDGFKPSHRKPLYTMYKMGPLDRRTDQVCQYCGGHHEAQPSRGFCHI